MFIILWTIEIDIEVNIFFVWILISERKKKYFSFDSFQSQFVKNIHALF